jgi:uncharacterized damage-inducible protein DinB
LDYLRACRLALELKCAGLDAEQLARRSVPPSTMSLLGLIRHMADVERNWFRRVMAQAGAPPLYWSDDVQDADWAGAVADPAVVAGAWRAWREEVAFAEQFVAGSPDLAVRSPMQDGTTVALREVILHMVEEYARHLGHADLLRERIDAVSASNTPSEPGACSCAPPHLGRAPRLREIAGRIAMPQIRTRATSLSISRLRIRPRSWPVEKYPPLRASGMSRSVVVRAAR